MEDEVVVHKASDHNVTKAYFIFKILTLTFLTHHSYVTGITERRFVRSCTFSPGTLISSHREVGSSSR